MAASPSWYRIAADRGVANRALLTSVGVGTLLTLVNHADDIRAATMGAEAAVPIAITYVVPFLVSLLSSVIALRVERRSSAQVSVLLEREIAALNRFPGQNPNPVMRVSESGRLRLGFVRSSGWIPPPRGSGAAGIFSRDRLTDGPPLVRRKMAVDGCWPGSRRTTQEGGC